MRRLPTIELLRRALRERVCTQCVQRPEGSEHDPPTQPRACEPQCTVFLNLPKLKQIARMVHAPTLGPYEEVFREEICSSCQASPTSGDFCHERTVQDCPLSRQASEVLETITRVLERSG